MPKILEMSMIDDALWCRVGDFGDFPSGVTLWTPDEITAHRNTVIEEAFNAIIEYDPDNYFWMAEEVRDKLKGVS